MAIIFALTAIPAMLITGIGVDYAKALSVRTKLQNAGDAAAFAAVAAGEKTEAEKIVIANKAFVANTLDLQGQLTVTHDVVVSGDEVTVNTSADVPAAFMALLPFVGGTTPEGGTPEASFPVSTTSTALASGRTLEVSIMLDVTGSMAGQKLADMKWAAKDLMDVVMPVGGAGSATRVALVPFADRVNPGAYAPILTGLPATYQATKRKCVRWSYQDNEGGKDGEGDDHGDDDESDSEGDDHGDDDESDSDDGDHGDDNESDSDDGDHGDDDESDSDDGDHGDDNESDSDDGDHGDDNESDSDDDQSSDDDSDSENDSSDSENDDQGNDDEADPKADDFGDREFVNVGGSDYGNTGDDSSSDDESDSEDDDHGDDDESDSEDDDHGDDDESDSEDDNHGDDDESDSENGDHGDDGKSDSEDDNHGDDDKSDSKDDDHGDDDESDSENDDHGDDDENDGENDDHGSDSEGKSDKENGRTCEQYEEVKSGPEKQLISCVTERVSSDRYTDADPAVGQYVGPYLPGQSTTHQYSVDPTCRVPDVKPLTTDRDLLRDHIDSFVASGGTAGHLGTAWSWYTVSPKWNDVFPAESAAKAYSDKTNMKAVVLMSDGDYNVSFSKQFTSAQQARKICKEMKKAGITIYTVGFGIKPNSTQRQTMEQCATSANHSFFPYDGDQLRQAFRSVGKSLVKAQGAPRLSK